MIRNSKTRKNCLVGKKWNVSWFLMWWKKRYFSSDFSWSCEDLLRIIAKIQMKHKYIQNSLCFKTFLLNSLASAISRRRSEFLFTLELDIVYLAWKYVWQTFTRSFARSFLRISNKEILLKTWKLFLNFSFHPSGICWLHELKVEL